MEGNSYERTEERKEDQFAAVPAAGNETTAASSAAGRVTTSTSTVPRKEVMSTDVEAIASVMVECYADRFNTASGLNIVAAAQLFVAKQDWDGLESYLAKFLTEIQGDKFHPHPGLFCSLYQAHISYLIRKKQFLEARAVFDGKVKPLLDKDKDDMYKPFDLEDRVELLQNCVNNCLPPPADEVEDINVVLSDYLMLYFPTSLQREVNRTHSFSDFLMSINDEKGKRYRCLACQWVMPPSARSGSIICYKEHFNQVYCCPRVTKWMVEYLSNVEGGEEIDIQDLAAPSSGIQSRKRKAPLSPLPTVPDEPSVVIPVELVLGIWNDICRTNMRALSALDKDKSQSATEAKKILFRQEELIVELKNMFLSYMRKNLALGSVAFLKIKALLNLSDDLFPLLKNLPRVSELLLQQDVKVAELRRCFMDAAAERLPPAAPIDAISSTGTTTQGTAGAGTSSTTSSNSISSRLL